MKLTRLRNYENFHILLWLFKDLAWVLLWKPLGLIMIFPTVFMAAYITWLSRDDRKEFAHSLAVLFWIMANSVWMIGEFYYDDGLRSYALIFFVLGLFCVLFHYVSLPFVKKRSLD